jgi:hypothetical protein
MALSLARVAPLSTNRNALAGGLAFLEGSASPRWGGDDLRAWFTEHLVAPGCMTMPALVTEPSAGTISLHGAPPASAHTLRMIVVAARIRVLSALRDLTASPSDDRFLRAAIFAGRASRQRVQGSAAWVARPEPTAPLSGVVLSLFAVDALSHRELYNQLASVCETCNRVTFHEGGKRSCPEHTTQVSGVFRKVDGRDRS